MRAVAQFAIVALAFTWPCLAQDAAPTAQAPAATGNSPAQQQKNAASATQDNSGTTGDQITKPAQAKGSTVIGCLSGPDKAAHCEFWDEIFHPSSPKICRSTSTNRVCRFPACAAWMEAPSLPTLPLTRLWRRVTIGFI